MPQIQRYLVLLENFMTGEFVQVGSTDSLATTENARMVIDKLNRLVGETFFLIWVKDRDTNEVF